MNNNQAPKGLVCPNAYCKTLITFSYTDLLTATHIECPKCRLRLEMRVPEEIKGHLENIAKAEEAVNQVKNFGQ